MSKWFILTLCSVLMRLFSPAQSWPAYSVTVCDKQPSGYYFFQVIKFIFQATLCAGQKTVIMVIVLPGT